MNIPNRIYKTILICALIFPGIYVLKAQLKTPLPPFVGANVSIPACTPERIERYFRIMNENNFTVCRVNIMEGSMRKANGTLDFSLYDHTFRMAEQYGIKIFACFNFESNPRDEAQLLSMSRKIEEFTNHYKQFPALYAWMLANEPGVVSVPGSKLAGKMMDDWKKSNTGKLSEQEFILYYNAWVLNWIADEIKKHDTKHEIHVNARGIFQHYPIYDLKEWRKFLTIFGISAHPAWHFSYFDRQQYTVGMSATCEVLRSGAGDIPFMVTELQGGNNIWRAVTPFCPTKEEIVQWLWIITGSQGRGSIFWSLNPSHLNNETGEWGMVDYQDKPSDRMLAASEVAAILKKNEALFMGAKVAESGINILINHESLWTESLHAKPSTPEYEARTTGGVMKSALGYFEALGEMGVNAGLKEIDEFDFSKADYKGQTIILAHQICLPERYVEKLENFVRKGGKLIVDGLTGYFDENTLCYFDVGSPFEKLLGGTVSEFKHEGNLFTVSFNNNLNIPAHFMRGYLAANTAEGVASLNGKPVAIRNRFGQGEVLWVPSLIGLGSRMQNDYAPLCSLLGSETATSLKNIPFRFKIPQKNMLMKTLQSGNSYITVIVNKSEEESSVELILKSDGMKPIILYANKHGVVSQNNITIAPEETMVIQWE